MSDIYTNMFIDGEDNKKIESFLQRASDLWELPTPDEQLKLWSLIQDMYEYYKSITDKE